MSYFFRSAAIALLAEWSSARPGSRIFVSVLHQAGLTRERFETLYWASR